MMEENDDDVRRRTKSEQRIMWIFSGAIVLLILGMMGANVLFHTPGPAENTEFSSQSRSQ